MEIVHDICTLYRVSSKNDSDMQGVLCGVVNSFFMINLNSDATTNNIENIYNSPPPVYALVSICIQ